MLIKDFHLRNWKRKTCINCTMEYATTTHEKRCYGRSGTLIHEGLCEDCPLLLGD